MSNRVELTPKLKAIIDEWRWGKGDASFLAMTDGEVLEAIFQEFKDASQKAFELQNEYLEKCAKADSKLRELNKHELILKAKESKLDAVTCAKVQAEYGELEIFADGALHNIFKPTINGSAKEQYLSKNDKVKLIMKSNCFGPKDWYDCLGRPPLPPIPEFPWSEDLLDSECPFNKDKKIKDTHFAFLGGKVLGSGQFNIRQWRNHFPTQNKENIKFEHKEENCWYRAQPFSGLCLEYQWYLMPQYAILEKDMKYAAYQELLASRGYRMAKAIEEVTKLILYYISKKDRLNSMREALCSDPLENLEGRCLLIGRFIESGINISHTRFDFNSQFIGTSAVRLLPVTK